MQPSRRCSHEYQWPQQMLLPREASAQSLYHPCLTLWPMQLNLPQARAHPRGHRQTAKLQPVSGSHLPPLPRANQTPPPTLSHPSLQPIVRLMPHFRTIGQPLQVQQLPPGISLARQSQQLLLQQAVRRLHRANPTQMGRHSHQATYLAQTSTGRTSGYPCRDPPTTQFSLVPRVAFPCPSRMPVSAPQDAKLTERIYDRHVDKVHYNYAILSSV
mmetsp:Transcript_14700/g.28267  ORF Transcript_14700/g.28267 Transcript_14700/m.28267 type:complete len:215 (+) Transcript_14700:886-1530(+)